MELHWNWTAFGGVLSALGAIVTAVATIFLWRVTRILAVETRRMADAAARPHIVATLEPNRWSMIHLDLHVDNTGNATAYDIEIGFSPPIEPKSYGDTRDMPLQKISVLKPGSGLTSYLCEYGHLQGMAFTVSVSWRRKPNDRVREENTYTLNLADLKNISRLGDDPMTQIAKHIKNIDEQWKPVARGNKRLQADVFTVTDRLHEERLAERRIRQVNRKQSKK